MLFVIASRVRAVNLGARLQFEDSSISTCFHVCSHEFRPRLVVTYLCYALCCRDVHFCGVVRVVDAVFARLFVCAFVLWCCFWFVPFGFVVLFWFGSFWGLVRVVLFCFSFWVVLCCVFVGLLVCLLVGWSIGWLRFAVLFVFVLCCCFLCWLMWLVTLSCVVLLFGFGIVLFG